MRDVNLWYEAFNKKDSSILDKILSDNWEDIPAAPGQSVGKKGAMQIIDQLKSAFPDFNCTPEEILQDGNKITVRSKITGTQKTAFAGFPSKNRKLAIQAIDIHEFKDGKIIRTWHTEDWMTGLQQLGVFEK